MEEFFRLNIFSMILFGIWPYPVNIHYEKFKKLLFFFHTFLILILACTELWQGIYNYKSIILLAEGVSAGAATVTNIIKASVFFIRLKFIRELFNLIKSLDNATPIKENNGIIGTIIKKWQNITHILVKFFAFIYIITCLTYLFFPWYWYFNYGKFILPLPAKFPIDTSYLKNYLPVYFVAFIGSQSVLLVFIVNETLYVSLIMYICSRVDILEYCIMRASEEATIEKKTTKLFKISVEYHKKILRLCEMVGNLYSPILLVQFLSSTATICMMCFLTTENKIEKSKQLTFTLFLASLLVQLFIYCFFGQLLQSKFEKLHNVGFNSSWYTAPVTYQKNILFFIKRCSQPVNLSAYKMMPANLQSYFSICKTCISYLAILQSLEEEQNK